jgi:hypothetical protein
MDSNCQQILFLSFRIKATGEKQRGHNSIYPKGGFSCFEDSFVINESSVLRTNFCAEKPAHRQSAKRYSQL